MKRRYLSLDKNCDREVQLRICAGKLFHAVGADIENELSDASRDLETLTFDLGGHGACRSCGSSCSVCIPSFKFVASYRPSRSKILGI